MMAGIRTTLAALTDGALARRIAREPAESSSAEASELYRRHAPRVRLYGRRYLRDETAADALAHEVLRLAIERLREGEVRDPDGIGSFILDVSRSMAQAEPSAAPARETRTARVISGAPDLAPATHSLLDAPRVAVCLRTLTERDRIVVLSSFYAGQDVEQIATDLGTSPDAVRRLRQEAMARLRDCVLGGAPA